MRAAILLAVFLGIWCCGAPADAQIADYWGFSNYPLTVGLQMHQEGFVVQMFAPLTYDMGTYQYTYAAQGMVLSQIVPLGPSRAYTYLGGTFSIYEDASHNAVYDDSPCSLSAPETFTDGTLYLQATVDTLTWIYNTMTQRGSYDAVVTYVGGTHLSELPLNCRQGALFGGTTGLSCTACIPSGYNHRWDGQAFFIQGPTAAEESSWGSVKQLFK